MRYQIDCVDTCVSKNKLLAYRPIIIIGIYCTVIVLFYDSDVGTYKLAVALSCVATHNSQPASAETASAARPDGMHMESGAAHNSLFEFVHQHGKLLFHTHLFLFLLR
jgi:hypothetical protein